MKFAWQKNLAIDQFGGGFYIGLTYMRRFRSLTFFVGSHLFTITYGQPEQPARAGDDTRAA